MPNWCSNTLTLTHEDVSKIDALEAELNRKNEDGRCVAELFNYLRPNPAGEWDYGWCVENWGTKWEASLNDWERIENSITFYHFDTAWSPPVPFYEYLTENGWVVDAMYYEPGVQFCGTYTSENGDEYYEYDFENYEATVTNVLSEDLLEYTGIRSDYESYLEDKESEE